MSGTRERSRAGAERRAPPRAKWAKRLLVLLGAGGLAACAGIRYEPATEYLARDDRVGACARLFARIDETVARYGVADTQSQRVPGFPYLRTDRLLGSYDGAAMDGETFAAWVDALAHLDRRARSFELKNLPPHSPLEISDGEVSDCRAVLRQHDLQQPERRSLLARRAVPRDAYEPALRLAGLYPLSAIPMRIGIARLHAAMKARFAVPLAQLPSDGTLTRFRPSADVKALDAEEVAAVLAAAGDALGRPLPSPERTQQLLQTFAPVFEIDVASSDDRIGWPGFEAERVRVDTGRPVVFTLTSHTRFRSDVLLQLNYVIWFPARPRAGVFDLLSGPVDGLIWRVTLGRDGRPMFYDAVHNCGCFYMAFPTDAFEPRPARGFDEPVLAPQTLWREALRPVIRLASRTHYIERVYPYAAPSGQAVATYELRSYDRLRSLPTDAGYRSLFGPDGIVKGTERAERWLYWPMGVREPGAMRQWGNHAIAFVGRRHFDDPDLIERHFRSELGSE